MNITKEIEKELKSVNEKNLYGLAIRRAKLKILSWS